MLLCSVSDTGSMRLRPWSCACWRMMAYTSAETRSHSSEPSGTMQRDIVTKSISCMHEQTAACGWCPTALTE